ncbi:MAG TPA: tryptophan synthase subunit beta, partial [Clostridium sp.]
LIGVEGAGLGVETGEHAAALAVKDTGVLHGMMSYVLKDDDGQIKEAYSISAGLDYPSVGPEHAYLSSIDRAQYVSVVDKEAVDAFLYLTKMEGIVPALESAHAVAYAMKFVPTLPKDNIVIINISGRGDKDMDTIIKYMEDHHE